MRRKRTELTEDEILTNNLILKGRDIEQIKKENNKNFYRHYNNGEVKDFVNGCVPTPRNSEFYCNDVLTYLYILTYEDKHINSRPEKYRWVFPDKKIGIAYDVENRVKSLEQEISCGRKGTKTLTPIGIRTIKLYKISQSDCFRFERYMHDLLRDRWTEGEWFTDYEEDLVGIVERELQKFVHNEGEVIEVDVDDLTSENVHRFEKVPKVKDNNDIVVYRL